VPTQLEEGWYESALGAYDRKLIASALEQAGGNLRKTARLLRLSRNGLKMKIKRLGLAAGREE